MVRIRRAQARDAETIARLCAEAAAEEGAVSALDVDRIRAHAFGTNALFECWVAEEGPGKPCAQAIITKTYDIRRGALRVVLCELYVAPAQRRAGLARRLMSAAARRAMELGARDLTITTGVDNAVAQRFFAAIGAHERKAAVFQMNADGIEWLAAEAR
jgi:ribosomal protein S18 acetylase RimI-like enzyme